jgi:hypothetical protein
MKTPNPADPNARKATLQPPGMLEQTDQQNDVPLTIPDTEIAGRAYARWEEAGRPHGGDQAHWFAAEDELRRKSRSPGASPAPGGSDATRE